MVENPPVIKTTSASDVVPETRKKEKFSIDQKNCILIYCLDVFNFAENYQMEKNVFLGKHFFSI